MFIRQSLLPTEQIRSATCFRGAEKVTLGLSRTTAEAAALPPTAVNAYNEKSLTFPLTLQDPAFSVDDGLEPSHGMRDTY